MDDGRKVITIAHPEHSSGELKMYESDVKIYVVTKYRLISRQMLRHRRYFGLL